MGSGFQEFKDFQKGFKKGIKDLEQTNEISFDVLFNPKFIQKHTKFSSIDDFLEQSGFDCSSTEAFDSIPSDALDKYVRENTSFHSWQEMLEEATNDYITGKLGF